MGCSISKRKSDQSLNLEKNIQRQISDFFSLHQNIAIDEQQEISVYDQNLDRTIKVPKLRQPIYNRLVQRRKIQQLDTAHE